ncbi:MAG: tetratricopeptide repeat protein [Brevundimonas sp.]|nr:tetratricopeptide repeat protein [Brevundimonas sp.]
MKIHRLAALGLFAAVLAGAAPSHAQTAGDGAELDTAVELINTDPAAAYAIFQRLSDAGDAEAKNGLATLLEHGFDGMAADPERARVLLREAADQGSDGARLNLGIRMLMNDTQADDADAVALLNLISKDGPRKIANWPLGRAYLFGQGVEQDLTRGSQMMMVAVEANPSNADAQFLLGRAYQQGWGIPRDPRAAFSHLRAAADAGDERAQWQVGMMLLNGEGVARDQVLARRYVAASAEAGYLDGMVSMAVMYALGEGGPPDAVQARRWYQRAAETGSAHAMRGVAGMLMTGEGGPVDEVTGVAYMDLAAKAGDANAIRMQQLFAARIAAQDRAAVEAVKSRWLREHGPVR